METVVIEHQKNWPQKIRSKLQKLRTSIIVLDDDPTGTQTVHDVPVLTVWDKKAILSEFRRGSLVFFILTNTRSLPVEEAVRRTHEITTNVKEAAAEIGARFFMINRGDSTLRGHYPEEINTMTAILNEPVHIKFIIPAFIEGGRLTKNDTHYLKEDGQYIPIATTPYAKDPSFGYYHSNLKLWVEEKTNGEVSHSQVISISLTRINESSTEELSRYLQTIAAGSTCIVNALNYDHLFQFSYALLQSGVPFIARSAASFVSSISGIVPGHFLDHKKLLDNRKGQALWVIGSYVPKTSAQIDHLKRNTPLNFLEMDVEKILDDTLREEYISALTKKLNDALSMGDTAISTSRKLITKGKGTENLKVGRVVSSSLIRILSGITTEPAYVLAKGGITSSDTATEALGVRRAQVLGQVIAGVPVWRLSPESRFPGLPYIIFPGNVGETDSLTTIYHLLHQ